MIIRKLGKKIASGILAITLITSFLTPQSVNAYSNEDRVSTVKELAKKYESDLEGKEAELKINPIREGVNTNTEDYQSIIVEFNSLPLIMQEALNNGVQNKKSSKELENEHKIFENFLASKSKERSEIYTINYSYYNTYNGVAMRVKGTDIETLLDSGVIKAIWKDEEVKVDPVSTETATYSVDQADSNSRMVTSTPLVGVDKLRNEGITGTGIKVGVIDTGIDYNHPDLKDNYKGGYDFVDNDNDPMETTYEDWVASGAEEFIGSSAYYTSHGTHVSGTIGATGSNSASEFAVTGLAPDVDLYAYRVLGPYGSGDISGIIAAIEKSVEDGMDVINLSLGIGTTDSLYPGSVACNNATLAGVVTVVANGNAGPGLSTVGAPGSSPLAISVGASTTDITLETFDVNLSNGDVINGRLFGRNFESFDNFVAGEYEVIYGGLGSIYELADIDVKGKVVLIDRGELNFTEKHTNAFNAGAAGVLIANNIPGEKLNSYIGEASDRVTSVAITMEEGNQIKALLNEENEESEETEVEKETKEEEIKVEEETEVEEETKVEEEIEVEEEAKVEEENEVEEEIKEREEQEKSEESNNKKILKVSFKITGTEKTEPDVLADFSSRGPASDETIKPDVVAPGDGIFSTYPEYVNSPEEGIDYSKSYSRISGTSMASPHVAGIAALILQNDGDMTPEEVKVALMNSSVDLKGDYPINAVGAGRVDAYKAVHNDISISVIDKCTSISLPDENSEVIELDYITGSLSFDRIYIDGENKEKSLSLKLKNDSDTTKNFNVSVRYLGKESLAENAEENGVVLEVQSSVSAISGQTTDFNATIKIPEEANVGRYEGYVILTNTEDCSEIYRLPFSASYIKPGIKSLTLSRYAVNNDLEMVHFAKLPGITAYVEISSPLSYMEVYVKDYETNERIGLVGYTDLSVITPGYTTAFYALDSRASYFQIEDNGEVTYIKRALTDGKYVLEFIAHSNETEQIFEYNHNVLIDNEDVTMKLNKEPGVYEITEDMMTTESYKGEENTAFWIHGNVDDNSISELQEMGYDTGKEDILVSGFLNGMPRFNLEVDENGDFMVGFEERDISGNVLEFSPMPIDMATSQNLFLPPRYFFVKEGTPYTSVHLDKDSMVEGENIISTIGVNNLEAGSTFKFTLSYLKSFEVMDIRVNDELQKILDENGYKLNIEKSIYGAAVTRDLELNLYVTDKDGNNVDLSDDIKLLDIEFKLVDDSESEFYKEYITCTNIEISDKDDNNAEMSYTSTYEGVNIKQSTSSIRAVQIGQGFIEALSRDNHNEDLDQYIWAEDNKGKKYELEYYENNDEYVAFNLPISTEEYKVITNLPGHFRKEARFMPSRVLNGEVVGKMYYLLGSEFYKYAFAGDVNKDDVIDIHDAIEVEKYYGQKVDYKKVPVDFNFDGIVNADDMDYIINNFLVSNEQNSKVKEAESYYEGKSLEDILVKVGYYDEIRLDELTISDSYITLELNDPENNTAQLGATMNPEGAPNIELIWKSRCEDIVKVDQTGLVTAVNAGTTIIEVAASDGSARVYCSVTVTKNGEIPTLENVTAVNKNLEVYVGDKFDFELNLKDNDAIITSITYISSADSIVSIADEKGVAKSTGKAIVTANINEEASFVTWEVNVKAKDNNGPDDEEKPGDGGDNNGGNEGTDDGETPGDDGNNNGGNDGTEDGETPGEDGENNGEDDGETPGDDGNNNGGNTGTDDGNKPGDGGTSGSGSDSNNGGQSSNKASTIVKPDNNGKLPTTGGRTTLPIVVGALLLMGVGLVLRGKKRDELESKIQK